MSRAAFFVLLALSGNACGGTVAARSSPLDAGSSADAALDGAVPDARSDGASFLPRDPVQCAGGGTITYDKACTADADCIAVTVYLGCCHSAALGCNAASAAELADAGARCGLLDPCDCAGDVVTADDGHVVPSPGTTPVHVACIAGLCESSIQ